VGSEVFKGFITFKDISIFEVNFFLLSTTTISDCLHNLGFTRDFRVAGNANGSLVNELW